MRVRSASAADVPAVLPMVRSLCDLHQRHDPERFRVRADVLDRYAAWLPERAADPRSVFVVCESEGKKLVGFGVGTIEPEVPIFWIPECGWVHDVWIEPEARRSGAATLLVEEMVRRFTALGVAQVRLHTGSFNEAARAVFRRLGFRECVTEMLRMTGTAPTGVASV